MYVDKYPYSEEEEWIGGINLTAVFYTGGQCSFPFSNSSLKKKQNYDYHDLAHVVTTKD